jgi:hypothetical protein
VVRLFVPLGRVGLLPRSGYTKQRRTLALGRGPVKGALKVAPEVGHAAGITCEQPRDTPRPPLVRNMVELPRRDSASERKFSCSNWSELVAHLASRSGQTFESALIIELLLVGKEAQVKRHSASNESPN